MHQTTAVPDTDSLSCHFTECQSSLQRLGAIVISQARCNSAKNVPTRASTGTTHPGHQQGLLAGATIATSVATNARPVVAGDRLLENLYGKLAHIDRLQYPRSHHQVKFHDCFTRASLRIIYGDDFDRVEQFLLDEFDVSEFRTEVMIVTPRRFGKTFSVAQYCAAFATSIMGKEVAIFSTGRRASKKILDLVVRFIKPLLRKTQKITLRNVEEVHILDTETMHVNKVCSYPSKVQVRYCTHAIRRPLAVRVVVSATVSRLHFVTDGKQTISPIRTKLRVTQCTFLSDVTP